MRCAKLLLMQRQPNAEAIRVIRMSQGIRQGELARRAGISPSMLNKIEMGGRNASIETAAKIARALGVSLDAIAPVVETVALA